MFADFNWTCANYIYTKFEDFSTSAFESMRHAASKKGIRHALSVGIDMNPAPTQEDIAAIIADMTKASDCLAIIVTTQTPQKADVIYHTFDQRYQGQIIMVGDAASIPSTLHNRLREENVKESEIDARVNEMMRGVLVVEAFNGAGTERSVLMTCGYIPNIW